MSAQRRDGYRENSNKFSARNKRHRELNRYRFDNWVRRREVIGSKHLGNECTWRTVIGWQDPFTFDDILEDSSAFSPKFTLCSHNEDKRLIEQDLGIEVVLPPCGSRH